MASINSAIPAQELDSGLLLALRGVKSTRDRAIANLQAFINQYTSKTRLLMATVENSSVDYLKSRIEYVDRTIRNINKILTGLSQIDPHDATISKLETLQKKLHYEYNVLIKTIKGKLEDYGSYHADITQLTKGLNSLPAPDKTPVSANEPARTSYGAAAAKGARIAGDFALPETMRVGRLYKDRTVAAANLVRSLRKALGSQKKSNSSNRVSPADLRATLPPEALKLFQSSGAKSRDFKTSFSKMGTVVITNNNGSNPNKSNLQNRSTVEYNNAQLANKKADQKFWGDFSERLDVHLEKIEKYLKEISEEKGGSGHGGVLSGIWDGLKDLIEFKAFKQIFKTKAGGLVKSAGRGVVNTAKKAFKGAGNAEGGGNALDEIVEGSGKGQGRAAKTVESFKTFIKSSISKLNENVDSAWSKVAKTAEDKLGLVVEKMKAGGAGVEAAIDGFKASVSRLGNVRADIMKWGAETLEGFGSFSSKFTSLIGDIQGSLASGSRKIVSTASSAISSTLGDSYDAVKGVVGKGLGFLGGLSKALPFAGDAYAGYQSYKESGSIGRGVSAAVGSFGGRTVGGGAGLLTSPVTGPVGPIAGEIGGSIAGVAGSNALYDRIFGTSGGPRQLKDSRNKDDYAGPNKLNQPPSMPPIAGTALPDVSGLDDQFKAAGYNVKGPGRRVKHNDSPTLAPQQSAYTESANSVSVNTDAILVKLDDNSIRDLALLIYELFNGRKMTGQKGGGKAGGLFQQASYSTGGSDSSFGAGNNPVMGGGFSAGGGSSGGGGFGSGGGGGGGVSTSPSGAYSSGGFIPSGGLRKGHGVSHGANAGGQNIDGAGVSGLSGSAVDQNMELLRKKEQFRSKAYWDVNHWRTGYGSDTITDAQGNVRSVQQGDSISKEDAERDLKRRVVDTQTKARQRIGAAAWDKLNPGAKAAIGSIAYNYGSVPSRIVGAIKSGDNEQMARAVEGLSGDNNGVNSKRRQEEANIIRGSKPEDNALGSASAQANAAMSPSGPTPDVKEAQGRVAATRKLPIQPGLKDQIQFAAEKNGVQAEIFSGGQASEGPNRTGSHRHDNGGAADLKLYQKMPDGSRRLLDMRDPNDAKIMKGFTRDAVRAGATGVGGAVDYMGPNSLHIGGGKPAAWGAGGRGAPDPAIGEAFKEGMDDQKGGSAEFDAWKKTRDAKAATSKASPDSVTSIDPKSKEASIFNPANTPSSIKPGMGLGAMAKAMSEAGNAATPSGSGAIGSDGKYPLGTAPKIDSEAAMKKLGIGGDGAKSEADYQGTPVVPNTDIAYRTDMNGTPVNVGGKSPGSGMIFDKSDPSGLSVMDPATRNQALAAHRMREAGLTTAETQQGLGQLGAESGFIPKSENTHYSAAQLQKLWPSKFPTLASAQRVVRQGDSAIANMIYGNRMGNKGYANAGFNYRGHGEVQLTGRDAYVKMDKALGMNGALVKNPELANDPDVAAKIGAQYLADAKRKGADISTAKGATNAVGPAGNRQDQIKTRAGIAAGFAGKVDDLDAKGAAQVDSPQPVVSDLNSGSRVISSSVSSDTESNQRIPKSDPPSQSRTDGNSDRSDNRKNSPPAAQAAPAAPAAPTPPPAPPLTTASNDVPMSHKDLGLVVINSHQLV